MPRPSTLSLDQRFWSRVQGHGPNECWDWTGAHNSRGLPHFTFAARDRNDYVLNQRFGTESIRGITAQRVMWGLTNGSVPLNRVVFHTCGNRQCMNPNHMLLGSKQDQANQRVQAGRQAIGTQHGKAKLTPAKAAEIYEKYFDDDTGEVTEASLARDYGVDGTTISSIVLGHTWAHATAATPTFKWRKKQTTKDQHDKVWFNKNTDPRWKL